MVRRSTQTVPLCNRQRRAIRPARSPMTHRASASCSSRGTTASPTRGPGMASSGRSLRRHQHRSPARTTSLIYDETHRAPLVLFGGSVPVQGQRNDTWITQLVASATAFGSGCGTPALGLVPDPDARPVLGQTAVLTVTDVPHPLRLPCATRLGPQLVWQFTAADVARHLRHAGLRSAAVHGDRRHPRRPGHGRRPPPIRSRCPTSRNCCGLHLYLQAYSLAPGQNSLGMIVSNGVDWVFGAQ